MSQIITSVSSYKNNHARELVLSPESEIIRKLQHIYSAAPSVINSFNTWIAKILPQQYSKRPIRSRDGITIIENIEVLPPIGDGNKGIELTPQRCRERWMTYSANVYGEAVFIPDAGKGQIKRTRVKLGKIPIPLGCQVCWLSNKTKTEISQKYNECTSDPFGYFIIKGTERVLIIQERLRRSQILIYSDKGEPECRMTCQTSTGTKVVSLYLSSPQLKTFSVKVQGLINKKDAKGLDQLSLFTLYRMAVKFNLEKHGYYDESLRPVKLDTFVNKILAYIYDKDLTERFKWRTLALNELQTSLAESEAIVDLYKYLSERRGFTYTNEMKLEDGGAALHRKYNEHLQVILENLFPHLDPSNIDDKIEHLAMMTAKLCEYLIGKRNEDDRNSYSNKCLDSGARSLEQSFNNIWEEVVSRIQTSLSGSEGHPGKAAIEKEVDFIEKEFIAMFNNASKDSYKKENKSDSLKREAPLSIFAQIGTTNTGISRQSKSPLVRKVHSSQVRYICIFETPEGEPIGLVKHTAMLGSWSQERDPSLIINILNQCRSFYISQAIERLTLKFSRLYPEGDVNMNIGINNIIKYIIYEDFSVIEITKIPDKVNNTTSFLHGGPFHKAIWEFWDNELELPIRSNFYEKTPFPLLLNGRKLWWCEPYIVRDYLVNQRRQRIIPSDVLIYLNKNDSFLEISCEQSRPISPVFIVEKSENEQVGELVIDKKNLWGSSVDILLSQGCIELLDAREAESDGIKVAQHVNDVRERYKKSGEVLANYQREINDIEARIIEVRSEDTEKDDKISTLEMKKTYLAAKNEEILRYKNSGREDQSSRIFALKVEIIGLVQEISTLEKNEVIRDYNILKSKKDEYERNLRHYIRSDYTHCEIHPQQILGTAASVVPEPHKSQGPRVSYQAAMGKQALSPYHTNEHLRYDTSYKMLAWPQRTMFETESFKYIGLDTMPCGQNVVTSFIAQANNGEDAIIVKDEAIMAGKFDYYKKVTVKTSIKHQPVNFIAEAFELYKDSKGDPKGRYHAILPNGTPKLDAYIEEGQCVAGKVRIIQNTGEKINISHFAGLGEYGYVDSVLITTKVTPQGYITTMEIKLRQPRQYQPGDKLTARYSQKGVMSRRYKARFLPKIIGGPNDGVSPDLSINPHSVPSRMTMGMLDEMLSTKAAVYTGEIVNATSFGHLNMEIYKEQLAERGLDRNGWEQMVLPESFSGKIKMLQTRIFTGICYYQPLRHQVKDKEHVRSRGSIRPDTHQPPPGRSRDGGLRIGEMERDAIISHGSTDILLERLCRVSDYYRTVICITCGTIASVNPVSKTYICSKNCVSLKINEGKKLKYSFGVIEIPYVFKLLIHLAMGMGVSITLKTRSAVSNSERMEERFLV